jgi:hypothetical protein
MKNGPPIAHDSRVELWVFFWLYNHDNIVDYKYVLINLFIDKIIIEQYN